MLGARHAQRAPRHALSSRGMVVGHDDSGEKPQIPQWRRTVDWDREDENLLAPGPFSLRRADPRPLRWRRHRNPGTITARPAEHLVGSGRKGIVASVQWIPPGQAVGGQRRFSGLRGARCCPDQVADEPGPRQAPERWPGHLRVASAGSDVFTVKNPGSVPQCLE